MSTEPTRAGDFLRGALRYFSMHTAFKGRTRLVRSVGKYLLPASHAITCCMRDDTRMLFDLHNPMQFDMYYGLYEPYMRELICALLRPGDVMFDLGAHVGYYTIAAAKRVGEHGAVHAFEPLPANADALQVNLRANQMENVHVNRAAVADASGSLQLHVPPPRDHSAGGAATVMDYFPNATALNIPAIALDDYIAAHSISRIALMKMDIEAAEVRALRGMTRTLSSQPPRRIISEVNRIRLRDSGYAPDIIHKLLESYAYTSWQIKRDKLVASSYANNQEGVSNFLFLAADDQLVWHGETVISLKQIIS
jgi:FkbM family methyltransferase